MEKVGILVVNYGSRGVSYVDAFKRSDDYNVNLYIADKQKNPFNAQVAKEHVVIPDLNIEKIFNFAKNNQEEIDFAIVGPEKPIIAGIRDKIEPLGIPVICPTKEYALEESKVNQRHLLADCCPKTNPEFMVFDPRKDGNRDEVKKKVYSFLDELNNKVAVKPDLPGYGKGVGVWGDHFTSREEVFTHFLTIYENGGRVIIEEKINGEESSFQCFCDGKKIVPLPETRDYKRAFDDDKGPNTGGMGCYKDKEYFLPFTNQNIFDQETEIVEKLFRKLRVGEKNDGLRGIPFYAAFMHSAEGPKLLEINSRGGDPEIINVISTLKDDFVDVCYQMIEGSLGRLNFEKKATVLTYKVPPSYGGFSTQFPEKVSLGERTPVDLSSAYQLVEKSNLKIYPGSLEVQEGNNYALGSRTVASVGIADTLEEAREISLEGIKAIKGGSLWYRHDIASKEHIDKSIEHMKIIHGE